MCGFCWSCGTIVPLQRKRSIRLPRFLEPWALWVSPICGNIKTICDNISPICGNIHPICSNIHPICGNISPICGNINRTSSRRVPIGADQRAHGSGKRGRSSERLRRSGAIVPPSQQKPTILSLKRNCTRFISRPSRTKHNSERKTRPRAAAV